MGERLVFGVDWYPEQWDPSKWESDLERMREYGFSLVRIMEFAWPLLEPEKGRYDFAIVERLLELMGKKGLKAVIGTPTATFPAWLLKEGPVLMTYPDGRIRDFGTRRMACYNAPSYRGAASGLVLALAEAFGRDERIAGWQIDNEIGHEGSDRCVCENCLAAWPLWLEERYGEVARLNAAWGNVFWGTSYSRFEEVPLPRRQISSHFNPGLLLDYDRFMSDAAVSFVRDQLELLRPRLHAGAFITTNLFPPPLSVGLDMEELTRGMDFASWDNYPVWGAQNEPYPPQFQAFAESYIRGLRGREPFTVMEQFSGIQGHVALGHLPPDAQVALWTTQAIARGANRILYFRWRTAPYGQEQLCSGLLDTDDRETGRARVLRDNQRRCREELARLASTPLESGACLVYSKDDARVLREQYLSEGLRLEATEWSQAGYDMEMAKCFAPFAVFNVNADVKSVGSVDLERYSLVSLPLYQMAGPEFVERLDRWVRRGGTLVLGYRAGARDLRNWNIAEPLPGLFSSLAGVRIPRFESLGRGRVKLRFRGPSALLRPGGEVWAELLELDGAEPIAFYADSGKFYRGCPAIARHEVGKGLVYYLGTSPDALAIFLLYRRILREAGLSPHFFGQTAEVVERRTVDGDLVRVIMNHSSRPRRILGKRLGPWGWTVLG